MKLKLLKPIDFRADKFKAGDVVEMPEGLAQKLILDGIAIKAPTEAPTRSSNRAKEKGKK